MRVLFLTNIPTPYRVDFFNELGKSCDLTVLYELKTASDRNSNWLSEKAIYFKEIYLKSKKVGSDSALSIDVVSWLKDESYDLIIVGVYSTPTAMLAIEYLKYKKRKFILNIDGGMKKNDSIFRYQLKRHFISSASIWLSTSKVSDEYLIYYGADKDRLFRYPFTSIRSEEVLDNRVKPEEKDVIKKRLSIREEKVIVSVGRFVKVKGFDILLESCKYIKKDIGVYIIGDVPTKEYMMIKKRMGLSNVYFIDFKNKKILGDYYKSGDLFVLPTRNDPWGLVINEAMAYGSPIITTNKCVAGMELIEDGKNGYIVPVDNEKQLAKKINFLLENETLRNTMSENNLIKIREYTIESMAKKHIEIFTEIIES